MGDPMGRAPDSAPLRFALALGLAAATFALYAQVGSHSFVRFDDDLVIFENPHLALGLSPAGLRWALTTDHVGNWTPLTWLSLLADFELHGLAPRGYLLENAALHAAASALLFLALFRLTRARGPSLVVAGVFAFHPLHVESVAWAAQRKDVLSGFFFALTLLAYAGDCERPGRSSSLPTALAFAAGLLAKPMLVTVPFVLLILDYWPLGRLRKAREPSGVELAQLRARVWEKLPLFALSAVTSVLTFVAQHAWGTTIPLERLPMGIRVANAVVAFAAYLRQAIWPSGLAVFYPQAPSGPPAGEVASAALVLVVLTTLAARLWRRRPYAIVGWLWYLGMLLPVIGLVQVGSQARADRYTYLPLIGIFLAVVFGVRDMASRWPAARAALPVFATALLALLSVVSFRQIERWRDSTALFEHALAVTRENHLIHAHLGAVLLEQGHFVEGASQLREAVSIRPDFLEAVNNLAWLLATRPALPRADPEEPLRLARSAAQLTHFGNATVLDTLAVSEADAGSLERAAQTAERAATLARAGGQSELASQIETRVGLFRSGKPYTEGGIP